MKHVEIPHMPKHPMLAFAYVPFQQYPEKLYDLQQGLMAGTIFPELNQPMSDYEVRWEYE